MLPTPIVFSPCRGVMERGLQNPTQFRLTKLNSAHTPRAPQPPRKTDFPGRSGRFGELSRMRAQRRGRALMRGSLRSRKKAEIRDRVGRERGQAASSVLGPYWPVTSSRPPPPPHIPTQNLGVPGGAQQCLGPWSASRTGT